METGVAVCVVESRTNAGALLRNTRKTGRGIIQCEATLCGKFLHCTVARDSALCAANKIRKIQRAGGHSPTLLGARVSVMMQIPRGNRVLTVFPAVLEPLILSTNSQYDGSSRHPRVSAAHGHVRCIERD